jgi:levanbiose-producing levanase
VAGRSARWRFLGGYEGERFADSFVNGLDQATGTLTSPPFQVRRSHLMLLVAGGRDREVGVDLRVEGRRVHSVRGSGREILEAVFIPVGEHRGRQARLVIWDHSSRPWGHIAVDEIRQIEGPAPGVAP